MAIPQCAAGGVRHRRAGFQHRRHRAEGRRRRLSGQGRAGRVHPAAAGRGRRRAAAGADSKGPRRRRGRGPCLARPLCRARRRARGAVARGQPPRRQLAADHRLAVASAGQFEHPGRRQGGADQCHGPGRRGGAGAPPALHLARPEERAAEPVSRCPAGGSQALRRGQPDVAADLEGRAGRDRSRPRGRDRHHRQRTGDERRQIRLPRRRGPDPRRPCMRRATISCCRSPTTASASTSRSDPRSTGMGQRIVSAMASKLEASVERDPGHAGTRIVLRFRRVNKPAAKPDCAAAS